jgi:O-antigen/teichoic acid export membrane protein
MAAGWLNVIGMIVGDALFACHRFRSRLIAMVVALAGNAVLCHYYINTGGLVAAAWAAVASSAAICLLCIAFLFHASYQRHITKSLISR